MPIPAPLDLFTPQVIDTGSLTDPQINLSQLHTRQILKDRYDAAVMGKRDITDDGSDEYREPIPHHLTFAAVWNWHLKYYYTYYDEAQIDSLQNSLAMRRSGIVQELLWHRQMPIASLPFALEVDDPDDPGQVKVRKEFQRVIDRIPYFQRLKLQLLESIYYGKSGAQIIWDKVKIGERHYTTVSGHQPVNGDKIAYDWDGTPGIFIYKGSSVFEDPVIRSHIRYLDRGPCLFLNDQWYRDHFVISEFQPTDTDYLFESEKAAAVHGLGFRDRFYFTWKMYTQVLTWYLNAIERVGANGMLYAYYPTGNVQARNAVFQALKDLISTNVAAFPRSIGDSNSMIERLDPSQVGYDVMYQLLMYLEGVMRRGLLGQNLSSQSEATGLGSGVADFQGESREAIILYDATTLAETLDEQLVSKILKQNKWEYNGQFYPGGELPFNVKLSIQVNRQNVQELIASAKALWEMGVPLDMDDLRDKCTLKAPRSKASALVNQNPGGAQGQEGGKPGENGKPSANGQAAASDTAGATKSASMPGIEHTRGAGGNGKPENLAFTDDRHQSYLDTGDVNKQDRAQGYHLKYDRLRYELANFGKEYLHGAFWDKERKRAWISIQIDTPYHELNALKNALIIVLGPTKFRITVQRIPLGARWKEIDLSDFELFPEFYESSEVDERGEPCPKGECCPHCGARLERGDDGKCNRCGKEWPDNEPEKMSTNGTFNINMFA